MYKRCQRCGAEFFTRWRNTPNVCESCELRATILAHLEQAPVTPDPAQLDVFGKEAR